MEPYIHKVQYYETDKMGIAHHSNHIKWMEEARVDFFEKIGYDYGRLEKEGISSPVIGIQCTYKTSTRFEDSVEITLNVKEFKGVKLVFSYVMKKVGTEEIVAEAESIHCFVNNEKKPIILKKEFPELDAFLRKLVINEKKIPKKSC